MAGARELVEFGASVVVRLAPLGGDVALLIEFEEGRINSAVIYGEAIAAGLFDAAGDAVAVKRAEGFEGLEDHQGQSALPDVFFGQ